MTSGNNPSAANVELSYTDMDTDLAPGSRIFKERPYVEERRATVRGLNVCEYAFEGLDRTAEVTVGILWVAVLPIVPYFINHLPPSRRKR